MSQVQASPAALQFIKSSHRSRWALKLFAITAALSEFSSASFSPYISKISNTTMYDYVVVGSGPGGGPVAANLATAGYKVLLVDAGGDDADNLFEQVPVLFPRATDENPATQWNYFATRNADTSLQARNELTSYRLANGSLYTGLDAPADATMLGTLYPRAGTLGGCARHNALITIRSFDSDWDTIAERTGDSSWNGSFFQDTFEEIEHCNYLPNSVVGHGFDGWLWTELTSLVTAAQDLKIVSILVSAATAMGSSLIGSVVTTATGLAGVLSQDINAPGTTIKTGVYQIPLSMKDAHRQGVRELIMSVANATDADDNRIYHLDIKLNTLVTKINFDSDLRATGVTYLEGQSLYRADPRWESAVVEGSGVVNASKEVIVAAGAFNTPQLLKLSGIGPAAELAEFGIEQLVESPVGTNLKDHLELPIVFETDTNFTLTNGCTFMYDYPNTADPCLEKWLYGESNTAKGTYATSGEALGVVMKTAAAPGADPDMIIYGSPANFPGFFPGWANQGLNTDHQHWTWVSLKAKTPNTAGTVTLSSADPRDVPLIKFNTFDGSAAARKEDMDSLYESVQFSRRAMESLIPLDGSVFRETTPGNTTEEATRSYIETNSFGHHACCTAPIGSVLDSDFKVKGTQALRVVDASVFPEIPGFFVQLPIYLMSYKASAAILEDA